jgi:DNA-directed RNA polymerase subunit L
LNLKYIVEEKNHIEFELEGEEYSIPSVLKDILLEDPDVEFATYILGHPSRDPPKIVIKTKKKDAKKVLKEAIKKAISDFETIDKALTKSLK